jgi:peroxiredoxin (alkyl hydroperoxide reductase subunit C)
MIMTDTSTSQQVRLNVLAPDFDAVSTKGPINLHESFAGKWIVLFSYVADFTPVCTSEIISFTRRANDFTNRGVQLIGLSGDGIYSHLAFMRSVSDVVVPFPLIADANGAISRSYGLAHPSSPATDARDAGEAVINRSLFVIDPKRNVRAMMHYPVSLGRSVDEVLRIVDALQLNTETGQQTLANWTKSEKGVAPPPVTVG